jgi:hypothetical protein
VGDQNGGFADLGARLQKTEGATRVLVCRLRNRLRKLIRSVIANTVANPAQLDTELQDLQAVLRESSG